MTIRGKLFLIPTIISENTAERVIHPQIKSELQNIKHFLAEDIRTARRYLSSLKIYKSIEDIEFQVLNKDTTEEELTGLFMALFKGENLGIISESGCPGVADPGAIAVKYAHQNDIQVVPFVGPSSILLALMASGLNGQHFAFHGYLPIDNKEAGKAIKDFEKESRLKNMTQIFIETPYRNNALMQNLVKTLSDNTLLCRATDVTGDSEDIKTLAVKDWKQRKEDIPKLPTVFLFLTR
jgi:16S rRNA (cytidine1402-2'-O)-methyltransferase